MINKGHLITIIKCGQYNKNWQTIHALPEQAVQALLDLRGEKMKTVHCCKYQLACHIETDPIERAIISVAENTVVLIEPIIGM